jgi:nicotinamidase-related amidase
MAHQDQPIPPHFDPTTVGQVWKVAYQHRAEDARKWAAQQRLRPASEDRFKIALLLVDVQNTFCIPEFELYVGGRSGSGAVDDNGRLCDFIYRNMAAITRICPTMDTHQAVQIFHSVFLVNERGEHPAPFTLVTAEDVSEGVWKFNPAVADSLRIDPAYGQRFLQHYTQQLREGGKYDLTIWPYHAMLGGIGHALVSAVEEAVFFHCLARSSQPAFEIKGDHPFTENYSVLRPEVTEGPQGDPLAGKNVALLEMLLEYDALFIAGQAKSHCVVWTIEDLRHEIEAADPQLAKKVYLLEDCTSPVVISEVVDYTEPADAAFQRFAEAGMHIVRSTDSLADLPGIEL